MEKGLYMIGAFQEVFTKESSDKVKYYLVLNIGPGVYKKVNIDFDIFNNLKESEVGEIIQIPVMVGSYKDNVWYRAI